jgi:hypothetical protein
MGYGMFMRVSPKKELAHRVSWWLATGEQAGDARVLHTCDNPSCVRPDHLFLGTMRDNTQDMMKKGRGRFEVHKGEDNGSSKLAWESVRELRRLWGEGPQGPELQAQLAVQFGTCFSNVGHIVSGRSWKE